MEGTFCTEYLCRMDCLNVEAFMPKSPSSDKCIGGPMSNDQANYNKDLL